MEQEAKEEVKEQPAMKESFKIQLEFSQICTEIGDLMFKLRSLEKRQDEMQDKYKKALDAEKEAENKPEASAE
jgi:hypothetical protein